jgi:rubredoxin
MTGKLHVLQFRNPDSRRPCAQRVSFEELPEHWKCFVACDENGRQWKSARVEIEPDEVAPRQLFFATRDTGYVLEIESAA